MNKFTAGQWEYGATPCKDNADALAICKENIDAHTKPSSGYFFEVYIDDGRRTALVGHGPDGEANARLIASAPELLEALQECLAWMERARISGDCGKWEWTERGTYKTGLAVVAKATGEQP